MKVSFTKSPAGRRSPFLGLSVANLVVAGWVLAGLFLVPFENSWSDERNVAALATPRLSSESSPAVESAELRYPNDLVLSADDQFLYVANRRGTLSVVDVTAQTVVAQHQIGEQLSALAWLDPRRLLVTDETRHELIQLEVSGASLEIRARIAISPYPVALMTTDGTTCFVTSLWSRRLTELSLGENGILEKSRELDLPFAPRCLVTVPHEEKLIVADSFTGRLAVVSRESFQLEAIRTFPGHNLRGLAASTDGRMLVIAHQMLNDLAQTVRNDVHWGLLMSNDLRWLRFEQLLHDGSDLYKGGHMRPLGGAGNAAADPSAVTVAPSGTVVVALGGVNEVAVGREMDFSFYRIPVGKRPTAIAISSDSGRAYVANRFDDTISVVDLPRRETVTHISLGPQRPLTLVERGEQLFFSGRLSHDSWMSCHSCHTDGHTNGGLNDNFSDDSFGASKRVLSLLGVAGTGPFAWSGAIDELETQIRNSINHTMQSDKILNDTNMASLVAYLESLAPPPSLDRLRGTLDVEAIARGEKVFASQGCVECHAPPLYTTPGNYDVGLEDSQGNRHFNPPSLRGVSQRGPYFHDNRAPTLEAVFREHGHPLAGELSDAELSDLMAFLRSL